jgi:DNA polymerase III psi subunit
MRSVYLSRMGIVEWELRHAAVAEPFFEVKLNNAAGKKVGVIIAEIDAAGDDHQQRELLSKIAQAITPHFDLHKIEASSVAIDHSLFFIVLGKNRQIQAQSPHTIFSSSLSQLLVDPDLKKNLWSDIKKIRELFYV